MYMRITEIWIRNYRLIRDMRIRDIERALILVGKNNTGKTAILDAVRVALGAGAVRTEDFQEDFSNIEISVRMSLEEEDLIRLHRGGRVSKYRRYEAWLEDFKRKLPSFQEGELSFTFVANREGKVRWQDGFRKHNPCIAQVFPPLYDIDIQRNLEGFQSSLLLLQENEQLRQMRSGSCMFDTTRQCSHCFSCIGLINQKTPGQLNVLEAARLLDYKLYQLNLDEFSRRVNRIFRKNGGQEEIRYSMNRDVERMLSVTAEIYNRKRKLLKPIESMGKGMRSIYMLSLLEACSMEDSFEPGIVLAEEPEIFLHPQMQNVSGDILYRISRKNQVIFSTHSPNLLPDFNSRQIRQIVLGEDGYPSVRQKTDISVILDDLGYTAADLMNVDFVFIVEGKQDKSRLPLLLKKYYAEVYDENGQLFRTAILTTNSCTNIKTYANLKYMNQIYLKDRFLMIRDGDGQDPRALKRQLCRYYEERSLEDVDRLPRVTEKNVLILRYYSFENYFLNPAVMAACGVVASEEEFYEIFLDRWREYLHKIRSGQQLLEVMGRDFETVQDVKEHMEEIRIHLRGHNLYDIYYGKYRDQEEELLTRYIDLAPREDFADILDAVEGFIYFQNRRKDAKINVSRACCPRE